MPDQNFEARLSRVLLAYADQAVEPIDPSSIAMGAILGGSGRVGRPGVFVRDARQSAELRILLVAAGLLAALVLGTWLLAAGGRRAPALVDAVPTPTATPTATTSATAGPSPAANPGVAAGLAGTGWLADAQPIPALGIAGPRIYMSVASDGSAAWIEPDAGAPLVPSILEPGGTAGELGLRLSRAGWGCAVGDEGRYRMAMSPDGVVLAVTLVADPCATRATAFARRWVRSLADGVVGGTGIIDALAPDIELTLPAGAYFANTHAHTAGISFGADDRSFSVYAAKDPQGFTTPCSVTGGGRRALAPGVDAFAAYLRSIPQLTVVATEMTIGGHRALHIGITQPPGVACPGGQIHEWTPKADPSLTWLGWDAVNSPGSLYVVELPSATLVLGVAETTPSAGPTAREREIIDSVRFPEVLPIGP